MQTAPPHGRPFRIPITRRARAATAPDRVAMPKALHAGGRGGKERAASLRAEQRLAPGGPQGSPDPRRTEDEPAARDDDDTEPPNVSRYMIRRVLLAIPTLLLISFVLY